MRLNVGCGEFRLDGWLNIDITSNEQVRPDVVASFLALPFAPGVLDAVYLGHVLEHVELADVVDGLLHLRTTMKPGAPVMVVGPDCDRARDFGSAIWHGARYGAGRWAGDVHLWESNERTLISLLREAGYSRVAAMSPHQASLAWPLVSAVGWQCAVGALS